MKLLFIYLNYWSSIQANMLNSANTAQLSGPPHFVDLHVNPGKWRASVAIFLNLTYGEDAVVAYMLSRTH